MKKKLFLIRHAYAEDPGAVRDFERHLTLEGQSTVRALGRYLLNKAFDPGKIFCSPAARTAETAQNLVEELEISESIIQFKDEIYNASVRELLSLINSLDESEQHVVVIGHNPAISYFGEYLTNEGIGDMEPCSIVTIRLENVKWEEVSQGEGTFVSYFHPNNLSA
ncbi:MAG: histidine phosphatase family protein [Ekhidna sp.]|nr:histidine phosphatase family protein [Ekhidna sp.]MBC6411094.1 histidine phosphatase family protein [Ekhidna sp.]MBC6426364.1 histidine phosphatase family protein [Ekhidna sp.]